MNIALITVKSANVLMIAVREKYKRFSNLINTIVKK